MQLHLHAYRKDHEYQDCGPIDPEDAAWPGPSNLLNKTLSAWKRAMEASGASRLKIMVAASVTSASSAIFPWRLTNVFRIPLKEGQ
jgi:hypothetical protein